jgi:hypothetical protein
MAAHELHSGVWGAIMRVTMEHREESGIVFDEKNYYVDTTVVFSEEERAIIKARGLAGQKAASGYHSKIPSDVALIMPAYLRAFGPMALALSVLIGFFGSGPLGTLLFLAAAAGWAYGYIAPILHANAIKEYVIEVRHIISDPTFAFYAETPAHAKGLADRLAAQLADLKHLITESAELGAKNTFEL